MAIILPCLFPMDEADVPQLGETPQLEALDEDLAEAKDLDDGEAPRKVNGEGTAYIGNSQ